MIACLTNFSSEPRPDYRIGLPKEGVWTEVLNTDAEYYDGTGKIGNLGQVVAHGGTLPRVRRVGQRDPAPVGGGLVAVRARANRGDGGAREGQGRGQGRSEAGITGSFTEGAGRGARHRSPGGPRLRRPAAGSGDSGDSAQTPAAPAAPAAPAGSAAATGVAGQAAGESVVQRVADSIAQVVKKVEQTVEEVGTKAAEEAEAAKEEAMKKAGRRPARSRRADPDRGEWAADSRSTSSTGSPRLSWDGGRGSGLAAGRADLAGGAAVRLRGASARGGATRAATPGVGVRPSVRASGSKGSGGPSSTSAAAPGATWCSTPGWRPTSSAGAPDSPR